MLFEHFGVRLTPVCGENTFINLRGTTANADHPRMWGKYAGQPVPEVKYHRSPPYVGKILFTLLIDFHAINSALKIYRLTKQKNIFGFKAM